MKVTAFAGQCRLIGILLSASVAAIASGCSSDNDNDAPTPAPAAKNLSCDDSMKTEFAPDANTTVLLVRAFRKDDLLLLSGTPTPTTPKAANDLCLVKLNVGPGNPGPTEAPSTSPGIGIEVWLPTPANWNKRVHAVGGGGWQGGVHGSTSAIASADIAGTIAGTEGAVSSQTDTGHSGAGGSFAMNPDGTINQALWNDFSHRSLHEQADKTKALATAYYGSAPARMYWEGGSTGGRQGLKLAQANPADYDGMIVNYPAINWTKFITAELYPQIVYQRDLGGIPLTTNQFNLLGNAAIAACDLVGGQHLGYIPDPSACRYDPAKDASVLCTGVVGNGGIAGASSSPACVNLAQATAQNKIWYGQTSDGSVPDPAVDNGWALTPQGNQRWYGLTRGTTGGGLANPTAAFGIAADMVALELQNPTLSSPLFTNATGSGSRGWQQLSYPQLSNAFDRGVQLQPLFANINTDNPDLSAYAARGGKLLTWHGLNDQLIPPQGTVNYYNRVAGQMGGLAAVQNFWKFYLVPAAGHGNPNGTTNPDANPPAVAPGQLYALLTAWVEQGTAPDAVVIQSSAGTSPVKSRPICVYPRQATYASGDPNLAVSYTCQ